MPMSEIVSVKSQNAQGEWFEHFSVCASAVEERHDDRGWTDYIIKLENHQPSKRNDPDLGFRDISDVHLWRLEHTENGIETRPTVFRRMSLQHLGLDILRIRTVD
jgi:hypothetical protein